MPQLYSVHGNLVSKDVYDKHHGISVAKEQPKAVIKEKAKEEKVTAKAPKAKKETKKVSIFKKYGK